MNKENINYSFKYGNVKFNIDVSARFSTNSIPSGINAPYPILHYHAKHELFFVGEDPIKIFTENGVFEYNNCIVLIPPFLMHRASQNKNNRLLISYDVKAAGKTGFATFIKKLFSYDDIYTFTTEAKLDYLLEILGKLICSPIDFTNEAAISTLQMIFYILYLDSTELKPSDYSLKSSYLMTIERAINDYSAKPGYDLNLSEVAKLLHLSTKQTSRIIHKYFGKSLSDLVIEKRLTIAKQYLLETDKSISEIARYCNFRSENYFYLTFKREFGCTPAKYRKRGGDI